MSTNQESVFSQISHLQRRMAVNEARIASLLLDVTDLQTSTRTMQLTVDELAFKAGTSNIAKGRFFGRLFHGKP